MKSASARVRSCHAVSGVPQKPQNWRRSPVGARGCSSWKVRRIRWGGSSGKKAEAEEWYQERGTRRKALKGVAWWRPGGGDGG